MQIPDFLFSSISASSSSAANIWFVLIGDILPSSPAGARVFIPNLECTSQL